MDTYLKFDLHIHSFASSITKTGDKTIVANSKLENLSVLVQKLIENTVNIVAITDHNYFDRLIYEELKKQEKEQNCIYKVLPGIEIDLNVDGKIVHVVCIFDDIDPDHAKKISEGFVQKESYTVDDVGSMLRSIELGVILIAHQKCDYKSENPQKTSLSYIGQEGFYKFLGCEFFDSLEIQNSKVEGILKSRFDEDNINNINLIVGSDCHEWEAYPAHHLGKISVDLQYMKCLPTFKGLVMSITDNSRIYKSPEPPKENALKSIEIECKNQHLKIEMSNKINVIIGDNSVGKSTLIKYLTGTAEKPAIDFFKAHDVDVITPQLDKNIFTFSGQGKIRDMFESTEEKLPIRQKFKDKFNFIDKTQYIEIVKSILIYYRNIWDKNEAINENRQNINRFLVIPNFTGNEKYYLSIDNNLEVSDNGYTLLNKTFKEILESFKKLNNCLQTLEEQDLNDLITINKSLRTLLKKYENKEKEIYFCNEIKSLFGFVATSFNDGISKKSSSDEQAYNTFVAEYNKAINSICKDIEFKFYQINNIWDTFKAFKIEPSKNCIGKYCFIDKPVYVNFITKELIVEFISKHITVNKSLEALTTSEILASIKGKRILDRSAQNINELLGLILESFVDSYFNTTVEIKKGDDRLNESNSAGVNALYYLDILSCTYNKSIFLIDQPEDDVSQSRISSDLIASLKNLSKIAQVILVTHNPQLVVNLDADNVIILKKEDMDINFYWGPLEFENDKYSILELVASTLDGGTDVIRKRWKRYAKSSI